MDVDPNTYYTAGQRCYQLADDLHSAFQDNSKKLESCGGMAGSEDSGKAWATKYNQRVLDLWTMLAALGEGLLNFGGVVIQAGFNHAQADYDAAHAPNSQAPTKPTIRPVTCQSYGTRTSAGGPGNGLVDSAVKIADAVGIPVPDGDTDKLQTASETWAHLATGYTQNMGHVMKDTADLFGNVDSPDAQHAKDWLNAFQQAVDDILGSCDELSKMAKAQKSALEDLRHRTLNEILKALEEALIVQAVITVATAWITFGVSAAVEAAEAGTTIAIYGRRIMEAVGIWRLSKEQQEAQVIWRDLEKSKKVLEDAKALKRQETSKPKPSEKSSKFETPKPGTSEYQQRLEDLAKDPAHGGNISEKSTREAQVGLDVEARGDLPGPIQRAQFENGKDMGEFKDATGQHWDVKAPTDTFPESAGPKAGQPMPPGMRGAYNRADFESMVNDELAKGQNVILDTKNLSPAGIQDMQEAIATNPNWAGKVIVH